MWRLEWNEVLVSRMPVSNVIQKETEYKEWETFKTKRKAMKYVEKYNLEEAGYTLEQDPEYLKQKREKRRRRSDILETTGIVIAVVLLLLAYMGSSVLPFIFIAVLIGLTSIINAWVIFFMWFGCLIYIIGFYTLGHILY